MTETTYLHHRSKPVTVHLVFGVIFLIIGLTGAISDLFDLDFASAGSVALLIGASVGLVSLLVAPRTRRRSRPVDAPPATQDETWDRITEEQTGAKKETGPKGNTGAKGNTGPKGNTGAESEGDDSLWDGQDDSSRSE